MSFNHQRRLDRALYHLESLKAEVGALDEESTYRTWSEPDVNPRKKLFWVEVLEAPPTDDLSLIIGDCLHNFRAALDNLAYELAIAHKGEPLASKIAAKSEFPIFASKNPDKLDELLGGIHPCAKAEIERLQPYNRGQKCTNDPLWQLNKLSNIDKHRLPHPALFATLSSFGFVAPMGVAVDEIEPIFGAVEDRALIARYPAVDDTGAEVDMQFTPTFSIGFGQTAPKQLRGMPIPERLKYIHYYIVRKVLPQLTPYLV